jgi:hypothetical protein
MVCVALLGLIFILYLGRDTKESKSDRIQKEYDKYGNCFCPDPELLDRV